MKRYKLVIPDNILQFVRSGLQDQQGEIANDWDERLEMLGWLEEVEDKVLTVDEFINNFTDKYPHLKANDMFNQVGLLMLSDLFKIAHQNGRLERDLEYIDVLEHELSQENTSYIKEIIPPL